MSIIYITPSYLPDIERFALLRRSIAKFAPSIPHLAIIQTEHLSAFRERFSSDVNLQLISTAEVLPPTLEKQRRLQKTWMWKPIERIAWRLGMDPNVAQGWKLQQLAKIYALSQVKENAGVFLDSDVIICRHTNSADYYKEDKILLLETIAGNAEEIALDIPTYLLTKTPLNSITQFYNYVHVGASFYKNTSQLLIEHLNKILSHRFDCNFLHHSLPSEYNILGYISRVVQGYDGYTVYLGNPRDMTFDVRYRCDVERLNISQISSDCMIKNKRYILIQSNLEIPVSEYSNLICDHLKI